MLHHFDILVSLTKDYVIPPGAFCLLRTKPSKFVTNFFLALVDDMNNVEKLYRSKAQPRSHQAFMRCTESRKTKKVQRESLTKEPNEDGNTCHGKRNHE